MLFITWWVVGTIIFFVVIGSLCKRISSLVSLILEYGMDWDYFIESILHAIGIVLCALLLLPWLAFSNFERVDISSEEIRVEYVEADKSHMMWIPTDTGYRLESYEKLFGEVYQGQEVVEHVYTYEWLFFEVPKMVGYTIDGVEHEAVR